MKFIAVLLLSLFSTILYAACSSAYQHAFINETNTKDNFIEIYILGTAPAGNYTVKACVAGNNCSVQTYNVNGTSSWYVKDFDLINNRSEFDITLYGPDGNVADYIRIGDPPTTYTTDYLDCDSIKSHLNTSAHTYHRTNSGQRDFYRYPDGSATWLETNWGNDTSGTSNASSLPQMLYVDDDRQQCPNAAYTTISSAVAAATNGSTIMVCSGTYNESINLTKDNLTVTSQSGNRDDVVVTNSGNVFYSLSTTDLQTTIKNLTIESSSENGIYTTDTSNSKSITFDNLKITAAGHAININASSALTIKNSCLHSSGASAVKLGNGTNHITIASNTILTDSPTTEALYIGSDYDNTSVTNNCLYGNKLLYLKTGGGGILGLLIPADTTTLNGNYYYGSTANPYTYIRPAHNILDLLRRFDDINPRMSCALPPCGSTPPPPEICTSFAYDLYHTSDPYRLQTRIAQHPFDVNVTVACTGSGEIPARKITAVYGVSGSCPTGTAGLPVLWSGSADINETQKTITLSGLNSPRAYSDLRLMLETDTGELNCSSDSFAIRPPSFAITSPASPIRAGNITLQLSATDSDGGYNGTASATTVLQTPDPDCPVSSGFLKIGGGTAEPLSLSFSNDTHSSDVNATDIGEIYLNIKDTAWTAVDQTSDCIPDSNVTVADSEGRFGCNIESNISLRIVPHHFDVNATLSNAGNGFTYLSNDLNMSATLDLRLSAQTEQNATTRNYNAECYAQTTNHTVSFAINPAVSVGNLHYLETNTSRTDINTTATSFVLTDIPKAIFGSDTNGSARLEIKLNFDRNAGLPVNPFDLNISSISVTDADGVTGSDVAAGDATFVYGRVKAYDITTDIKDVLNPVEIEVYGKNSTHGFLDGKLQNTLYWYRNINHDIAAIVSGMAQNNAIEVNATRESPIGGLHNIWITNDDQITGKQKITLELPEWLSITPANNTFMYQYIKPSDEADRLIDTAKGVNSGNFTGSDFKIQQNKNTTQKGIKVFR